MQLEKNHTELQKLYEKLPLRYSEIGGGGDCTSERQKLKSKIPGRIQKRENFSTQGERCERIYLQ